MKKATYFVSYVAALVIGVLLLVFSHQNLVSEIPSTLRGVVVAGGIMFTVAGAIMLMYSMRPKYDAEGVPANRPWYQTAMSIATIFWGILLITLSGTFTYTLAVTLGVSLVLAGLAQIIWIVDNSRPYGAAGWWYVIPACVIGAGIIDVTLVNDYANLGQSNATASIVSGILLLALGVNGFISLNRRDRIEKDVEKSVNEIHDENKNHAA